MDGELRVGDCGMWAVLQPNCVGVLVACCLESHKLASLHEVLCADMRLDAITGGTLAAMLKITIISGSQQHFHMKSLGNNHRIVAFVLWTPAV